MMENDVTGKSAPGREAPPVRISARVMLASLEHPCGALPIRKSCVSLLAQPGREFCGSVSELTFHFFFGG